MYDVVTQKHKCPEGAAREPADRQCWLELLSCDKLTKEWALLLSELCFILALLEVFVARLDEGTLEIKHKAMSNSLKQHT